MPSTRCSSATAASSAATPTSEILTGIVATRACVIGAGGAARTLAPALPASTVDVHRSRHLAARRDRLRPDRERDTDSRRGARRARLAARPSSISPTGRTRRRSSPPPARRVASSSTAERRSCAREPRASASGPGLEPPVEVDARRRQALAQATAASAAAASTAATITSRRSQSRSCAGAGDDGGRDGLRSLRAHVDVRRAGSARPGPGCRGTCRTAATAPTRARRASPARRARGPTRRRAGRAARAAAAAARSG